MASGVPDVELDFGSVLQLYHFEPEFDADGVVVLLVKVAINELLNNRCFSGEDRAYGDAAEVEFHTRTFHY